MVMPTSSRYFVTALAALVVANLWITAIYAQASNELDESISTPQPGGKSSKRKRKKKPSETEQPIPQPSPSVPPAGTSSVPGVSPADTKSTGSNKELTKSLRQELKKRYARNPVIEFQAQAQSIPSNALEILIGADSNPSVTNFGGKLRFFIPEPQAVEWLNWIGGYFGQSAAQPTKVAFLRTGSNSPDQADLTGSAQRAGLALRIPFLESVVSAVQMEIDLLNQFTESVEISAVGSSDRSNLTYRTIGPSLSLGIELTPAKNVFLGFDAAAPISQKVTAKESTGNLNGSSSGRWQRTQLNAFAGFRYFASRSLFFSGQGQLTYRIDQLDAPEIVQKSSLELSETYFSGVFGIGYVIFNYSALADKP